MASDMDLSDLRIPSYMNLEQAMEEVRKYLESKGSGSAVRGRDMSGYAADRSRQFALQNTLIAQLTEISRRFGHVDPNSKLGPPGVFLKKLLRKAIGWYSRPSQEFDRGVIEALQQVRRDMLILQQQITALDQRLISGRPSAPSDDKTR